MRVSEAMSRDGQVVQPNQTIQQAANVMAEMDVGALPVADGDRLVGMITARHRYTGSRRKSGAFHQGAYVMTLDIKYCFDHEDAGGVARKMGGQQVRGIPVVNRDMQLVGILTLADLAIQRGARPAGLALEGISRPGGRHTQTRS